MSREITVRVSNTAYALLAEQARDIGRGTKPEHMAEEWIEQQARETIQVARKFREAARIVDRRLRLASGANDG